MQNDQADSIDFLYKYRAIDPEHRDWSKRIFTHHELYFASPNKFNDPFDCTYGLDFTSSTKQKTDYLKNRIDEDPKLRGMSRPKRREWISTRLKSFNKTSFLKGIRERQDLMISEMPICSFSEKPKDILMWSHYGDKHKGYCLKFSFDKTQPVIGAAFKVEYSKDFPVLNPIIDDSSTSFEKIALTKAEQWCYEKEWRVIGPYLTGVPDNHLVLPGVKKFPPQLLNGVIFGCEMPDNDKKLIRGWCKHRPSKINFFQAVKSPSSYSLKIEPA